VTLRQLLGGDASRVHQQLDDLLDSEDSVIVLIDRSRVISYGRGLGVSPCQLELLACEIERAVRTVTGAHVTTNRRNRRNRTGRPCRVDSSLSLTLPEGVLWG